MAIFPTFSLRLYRPGKCLLRYSRTKKRLFGLLKQEVQKVQKLIFFQRLNPWFWFNNGHFSNFVLKAIQARKMSFTIFQNEKSPFQGIKTRSLRNPKIDIFPKGLTHGFGPKMAIFQNGETNFLAIKTRSLKSPKIESFPKGLTHGLGPKVAIFPTFFLRQHRPG